MPSRPGGVARSGTATEGMGDGIGRVFGMLHRLRNGRVIAAGLTFAY